MTRSKESARALMAWLQEQQKFMRLLARSRQRPNRSGRRWIVHSRFFSKFATSFTEPQPRSPISARLLQKSMDSWCRLAELRSRRTFSRLTHRLKLLARDQQAAVLRSSLQKSENLPNRLRPQPRTSFG